MRALTGSQARAHYVLPHVYCAALRTTGPSLGWAAPEVHMLPLYLHGMPTLAQSGSPATGVPCGSSRYVTKKCRPTHSAQ